LIEIRYRFKEDGNFRTDVENHISELLEAPDPLKGLYRIFSLRHEFPTFFHKLLHDISPDGTQKIEFDIERRHFPYFNRDREVDVTSISFYIQSKTTSRIDTSNLAITINDSDTISSSDWDDFGINMKEGTKDSTYGSPFKKWKIAVTNGELDRENSEDIFFIMRYTSKKT
jgi:hypothetical protein